MEVGICIPQVGALADPAAVRAVATAAERVGYASLWSIDRPAVTAPDGVRRPKEAGSLDPLGVLTLAAAVTDRIRLGAGVVAGNVPPAVLARSVATLDVISGGRVTVALEVDPGGEGWLARALAELDAAPTEPTRPELLLAAGPDAFGRFAHRADGWIATGRRAETLAESWAAVRERVATLGRDADALRFVVRAAVQIWRVPLPAERPAFRGSLAQVAGDLVAARAAGAHEVVLQLPARRTLDELLDSCARLAEAVEGHPC